MKKLSIAAQITLIAAMFGGRVTTPEGVPQPGLVTRATVAPDDVYDGDTFTATITTRVHVRLRDCWAPEVRGSNRAAGLKSRDALRKMIADSDGQVTISIPASERGEVRDAFSFGRVLAHAWTKDHPSKSLSSRMVDAGYAKPMKGTP